MAAPAIAASIGSLQTVLGVGVLGTTATSIGTMLGSSTGVMTVYGAFGVAGASVVGGKVGYLMGDVDDFVIAKISSKRDLSSNEDKINDATIALDKDGETKVNQSVPDRMEEIKWAASVLCISGWLNADEQEVNSKASTKRNGIDGAENVMDMAIENDEKNTEKEKYGGQVSGHFFTSNSMQEHRSLECSSVLNSEEDALAEKEIKLGSRRIAYMSPWYSISSCGWDRFCLEWEEKELAAMSSSMTAYLGETAVKQALASGAMHTALAGVISAFALPVTLIAATDVIDNSWSVICQRVDKVAEVLFTLIVSRKGYSQRPLSLFGFGLGARIIFKTLEMLQKCGCFGAIENVVLVGAPVTSSRLTWGKILSVVSGRTVNVYSGQDWVLNLLYRDTVLASGAAGLQPVCQEDGLVDLRVENVDGSTLDAITQSDYAKKMKDILRSLGYANAD